MLTIEILSNSTEIDAIAERWGQVSNGGIAAAFTHPAWYRAWQTAFPVKCPTVIVAKLGEAVVGILPVARSRRKVPNLCFSIVGPYAHGDYMPFLVKPEHRDEALPQMLDAIDRHFRFAGTFQFPFIPSDDPGLEILRCWLRQRGYPWVEEYEQAPRMRVEGKTFTEVEQSWSKNHNKEIRRRTRRLSEVGDVSLWVPTTREEKLSILDEFFEVHDQKWLSQGMPGRFRDPKQRLLFRTLAENLWDTHFFFSTVRCGEKNISYQFGFKSDGWIQSYRRTYRNDFHSFAPGTVHIYLLAQYASQNHLRGVDFLLGFEPHKRPWVTEVGQVTSIVFGRSRFRPSYWWMSSGKNVARQKLARLYFGLKALYQKKGSAGPGKAPQSEGDQEQTPAP